jgi:nicotinate-nucleotide--dimethylbenzimidazole phosphoribosyltransferase
MAGAIARARQARIPVVLDGFICCAAAACLQHARGDVLDHTVAGHLSAEGSHGKLLARMEKAPLLSLGMRLGEGSGRRGGDCCGASGGGLPVGDGDLCRGRCI